jgi:ATP-dependent Lon protease
MSEPDQSQSDQSQLSSTLPLLPLTSGVVLPGMVITMALETDEARAAAEAATSADGRLLLVPRVEGRYANVGTVSVIEESGKLPGGHLGLVVRGERRARIGAGVPGTGAALWVQVEPVDEEPVSDAALELAKEYRAVIENILETRGAARVIAMLPAATDADALADSAGYSPDLDFEQKVEVLETTDVEARLRLVLEWAKETLGDLTIRQRIRTDVEEGMEKTQREFLLRRQMDAIKKELGQLDGSEASPTDDYRSQIAERDLPEKVRSAVEKEVDKLERTSEQSPEHGWIRTWLDTVLELPWGETSEDRLDIAEAARILDADHDGLEDVKERILEHLAVRKLRAERKLAPVEGRGAS